MLPDHLLAASLALSLFVAPMALSFLCMRRTGKTILEISRREASSVQSSIESVRHGILKAWLIALVLSLASLMFFLHSCGLGGLVLWSASTLPTMICMMLTMVFATFGLPSRALG